MSKGVLCLRATYVIYCVQYKACGTRDWTANLQNPNFWRRTNPNLHEIDFNKSYEHDDNTSNATNSTNKNASTSSLLSFLAMSAFDIGESRIPFHGSERGLKRWETCICGKQSCIDLTKRFKELGDIRGTFAKAPTLAKRNKLERWRIHVAPEKSIADICTIDNRDRRKAAIPKTRGTKVRIDKFVAWHHFHPYLIKHNAFCPTKKHYICRDTIPMDTVKIRLQHNGEVNGYEDADRCKSKSNEPKKYYFVPSYPIAKATEDIEQLQRNYKTEELIEKVVSGSSTTRRGSPREKRKQMNPWEVEIKELKEAIYYMHKRDEARHSCSVLVNPKYVAGLPMSASNLEIQRSLVFDI
eukprot:CAMPEP_0113606228 /NCGR_PEP_ID=MMETSP0017_2-20120614/2745_1 /TAXON_ID=2856 /ORGANISM="Cylindrotheca closterium" /LENGTH=353 /DNA_ID=CAMNT_0000514763 /DNA_START=670 /DNA_END=1731 /DNA_ORIENTATION=- /assembly_acc=CAM_ASM_000147